MAESGSPDKPQRTAAEKGSHEILPLAAGLFLSLWGILFLNFLTLRPTRISAAQGLSALDISTGPELALLLGLKALMILAGLFMKPPRRQQALVILSCLALFLLVFAGARGAEKAAGPYMPSARVFLASGAWFSILGMALVFSAESAKLPGRFLKTLSGAVLLSAIAVLLLTGQLDGLSVVREYINRSGRFQQEVAAHILLSASALGIAALAGITLGFLAFSRQTVEKGIFAFTNSVQTIPSLALFGLLISPLAWLSRTYPFLSRLGIRGIGWTPALIALSLYALLPVVRNTYTAFKIIDPAVIDAGRGMGMNRLQLLVAVELPVALPVLLGGIRIAGVQTVGNTAVAALIGAGGLGQFIFQGLGEAAPDLILLGALSTVLLALAADGLFGALAEVSKPKGLTGKGGSP